MAPGGSACCAPGAPHWVPPRCCVGPGLKLYISRPAAAGAAAPAAAAAAAAAACWAGEGPCPGGTYEARNCCSSRTRHTQGLGRAWPLTVMVLGLRGAVGGGARRLEGSLQQPRRMRRRPALQPTSKNRRPTRQTTPHPCPAAPCRQETQAKREGSAVRAPLQNATRWVAPPPPGRRRAPRRAAARAPAAVGLDAGVVDVGAVHRAQVN